MKAGTNATNGFQTLPVGTEVFLVCRDRVILSAWSDFSAAEKECRLLNCDREEGEPFAGVTRVRIEDSRRAGT